MTYKSSAVGTGSTSSVVVTKPSGLAVNDIIEVCIYFTSNTSMSVAAAGWTLKNSMTVSGASTGRAYIYWRRVDGTEPASWTFTSNTAFSWSWVTLVHSGRVISGDPYAQTDVFEWNSSPHSGMTTDIDTTPHDLCDLVCIGTQQNGAAATVWTAPAGMTARAGNNRVASFTQDAATPAGVYSKSIGLAVGTSFPKIWLGGLKAEPAPGSPTGLTATPLSQTVVTLDWVAPVGGSPVLGYEVRVDAGPWTDVGNVLTYDVTGLTASTLYDFDVSPYGYGGPGSPASASATTLDDPLPTPPGYYRVALAVGSHSWEVEKGDPSAYGPVLPVSLGWDIPEAVDYFPAQPNLSTLNFRVRVTDASELADVVKGSTVTFRMYVDVDPEAEPWQEFDGVVTQLEGEAIPSLSNPADEFDFRVTVYAADDNARLADMEVGYTVDWPEETIADRLARILTEAGLSYAEAGVSFMSGLDSYLAARPKAPTSVLDAVRNTLKDAADGGDFAGDPPYYYGRYVYQYVHADTTLYLRSFRRRLFDDGVQQTNLNGDLVKAATSRWTKQPGPHAATWGLVDVTQFGTPDGGPPFVRRTSLRGISEGAPATGDDKDNLGESLLPDGSTALDGWSTRSLTYWAYLDPTPMGPTGPTAMPGWVSIPRPEWSMLVRPVVIEPIMDELEVNGEDYLAGTLTAARLTITTDGKYRVEFTLRAELLPGTILPA